jgi:hypothetical protein
MKCRAKEESTVDGFVYKKHKITGNLINCFDILYYLSILTLF